MPIFFEQLIWGHSMTQLSAVPNKHNHRSLPVSCTWSYGASMADVAFLLQSGPKQFVFTVLILLNQYRAGGACTDEEHGVNSTARKDRTRVLTVCALVFCVRTIYYKDDIITLYKPLSIKRVITRKSLMKMLWSSDKYFRRRFRNLGNVKSRGFCDPHI